MSFIGVGFSTLSTQANITFPASFLKLAVLTRDPNGAARADSLPTATDIIDVLSTLGQNFATTLFSTYINNPSTAFTVQLNSNTGVTLIGNPYILPAETVEIITTVTSLSSSTVTVFVSHQSTPRIWNIIESQTQGTQGGSSTGGGNFATRTLNLITKDSDPGTEVTLASNQFTIQPGIYTIYASAPGYQCDSHMIRLQNITSSSTVKFGTSMFSTHATATTMSRSELTARVLITSATTYAIQHAFQSAQATNGMGVTSNFSGATETYTVVLITKLA